MIYLYLFGTCFHFIYVFMIIGNNLALHFIGTSRNPVEKIGSYFLSFVKTTQIVRYQIPANREYKMFHCFRTQYLLIVHQTQKDIL